MRLGNPIVEGQLRVAFLVTQPTDFERQKLTEFPPLNPPPHSQTSKKLTAPLTISFLK
jgi:hypothetical protein